MVRRTPPIWVMPRGSRRARRWGRVMRWPRMMSMKPATVIQPMPPTRMRTQMMDCPARLQYTGVSTTTRPVTVTAEAAVKRAVVRGVRPLWVLEKGRRRRRVPNASNRKKPMMTVIGEAIPRSWARGIGMFMTVGRVSTGLGRRTTTSPGLGLRTLRTRVPQSVSTRRIILPMSRVNDCPLGLEAPGCRGGGARWRERPTGAARCGAGRVRGGGRCRRRGR